MLYYFPQVEVKPLPNSNLAQELPEVSGAFLNCLVSARSYKLALAKLCEALAIDSYTFIQSEEIQLVDGAVQNLPELNALLLTLSERKHEVIYGEFFCYE
jgi:hypothetical protein